MLGVSPSVTPERSPPPPPAESASPFRSEDHSATAADSRRSFESYAIDRRPLNPTHVGGVLAVAAGNANHIVGTAGGGVEEDSSPLFLRTAGVRPSAAAAPNQGATAEQPKIEAGMTPHQKLLALRGDVAGNGSAPTATYIADPNTFLQAIELNPLWASSAVYHQLAARRAASPLGKNASSSSLSYLASTAHLMASPTGANTSGALVSGNDTGTLVMAAIGWSFASPEDALLDCGVSSEGNYRHSHRLNISGGVGQQQQALCGLVLTTKSLLVVDFLPAPPQPPTAEGAQRNGLRNSPAAKKPVEVAQTQQPPKPQTQHVDPATALADRAARNLARLAAGKFDDDDDDDLPIPPPPPPKDTTSPNLMSSSSSPVDGLNTTLSPSDKPFGGTASNTVGTGSSPSPLGLQKYLMTNGTKARKMGSNDAFSAGEEEEDDADHAIMAARSDPLAALPACRVVASVPLHLISNVEVFANTREDLNKLEAKSSTTTATAGKGIGAGTSTDSQSQNGMGQWVSSGINNSESNSSPSPSRPSYAGGAFGTSAGPISDEAPLSPSLPLLAKLTAAAATSPFIAVEITSVAAAAVGNGKQSSDEKPFSLTFVPLSSAALDNPPEHEVVAELSAIPCARVSCTVLTAAVITERQQAAAAEAAKRKQYEDFLIAIATAADSITVTNDDDLHLSIGNTSDTATNHRLHSTLRKSIRAQSVASLNLDLSPLMSPSVNPSFAGIGGRVINGSFPHGGGDNASFVGLSSAHQHHQLTSITSNTSARRQSSVGGPSSPLNRLRSSREFFSNYQRYIAASSSAAGSATALRGGGNITAAGGVGAPAVGGLLSPTSAASVGAEPAKHILASFNGGKSFSLVTQSMREIGIEGPPPPLGDSFFLLSPPLAASPPPPPSGGVATSGVLGDTSSLSSIHIGGMPSAAAAGAGTAPATTAAITIPIQQQHQQLETNLIAMGVHLNEQAGRADVRDAEAADRMAILSTFWAVQHQLLAVRYDDDTAAIRGLHTSIVLGGGGGGGGTPQPQGWSLPAATLAIASLPSADANKHFEPQLVANGSLKRPPDANVLALIEQHEKQVRQRMGRYFTFTKQDMLKRSKDAEWTVFTHAHKKQLADLQVVMEGSERKIADLNRTIESLLTAKESLQKEVNGYKAREATVLAKARAREESLAAELEKERAKIRQLMESSSASGVGGLLTAPSSSSPGARPHAAVAPPPSAAPSMPPPPSYSATTSGTPAVNSQPPPPSFEASTTGNCPPAMQQQPAPAAVKTDPPKRTFSLFGSGR